MRIRRTLVLTVGLAIAVSLLVPAGAFSSTDVRRPVAFAVVDDDRAYLGVETNSPQTLPPGASEDRELVRISNQFPVPLDDVSATVADGTGGPPSVTNVSAPGGLDPGEAGAITADVDCDTGGDVGSITVAINASGSDGTAVDLARTVTLECTASSSG